MREKLTLVAMSKSWHRNNSGFSLIEICIVLIIAGLATAAFARYAEVSMKQQRAMALKSGIADLQDALATFEQINKRLPCPAPPEAGLTDASYGKEVCTGTPLGIRVVNGRTPASGAPLKVRIGTIPFRTLDIASAMMLDPWSRRITYAVTENNTVAGQTQQQGGITVADAAGSVTSSPGIARYVLFSHGDDGAGAYSAEGIQYAECGTAKDKENCDNSDASFSQLDRNTAGSAAHYDDYLVYNAVSPVVSNSGGCPVYCADNGEVYLCYLTPGPKDISVPAGGGWHNCKLGKNVPTVEKLFPSGSRLDVPAPMNGQPIKHGDSINSINPAQYRQTCKGHMGCVSGAELPVYAAYKTVGGNNMSEAGQNGPQTGRCGRSVLTGIATTCGNDGQWRAFDGVDHDYE